jgi:hypothetical protein
VEHAPVGEPIEWTLPDQSHRLGRLCGTQDGGGEAQLEGVEAPGFYSLQSRTTSQAMAVNVDARESDPQAMEPSALLARLGPKAEWLEPNKTSISTASSMPAREFVALSGFSLLALLVVEMFLATWFGAKR